MQFNFVVINCKEKKIEFVLIVLIIFIVQYWCYLNSIKIFKMKQPKEVNLCVIHQQQLWSVGHADSAVNYYIFDACFPA
jgi:hypothetical protein